MYKRQVSCWCPLTHVGAISDIDRCKPRRAFRFGTEGGHADFAPRTETEVELYRYLAAEYGHVSRERVCSGAGLVNIYRFLRDRDEPAAAGAETPTPAAVTAEARLDRQSLAGRALGIACSGDVTIHTGVITLRSDEDTVSFAKRADAALQAAQTKGDAGTQLGSSNLGPMASLMPLVKSASR